MKKGKIILLLILLLAFLYIGIGVVFNRIIYDPLGGVYLHVTDCDKAYIGGQGSFGGPETRFGKSFVKVPEVNWYLDNVETVAQSLWRIDGKLYDDSYFIFRERGIERTHRFANELDEAELDLVIDSYYGPVSFEDGKTTYVLHRSNWRSFQKVKSACPDTLMGIPAVSLEPARLNKVDSEKLLIYMIETNDDFDSRESGEFYSWSADYVIINGNLFYQPYTYQKPVDLGYVGNDTEVKKVFPDQRGDSVEQIVSINNSIYVGGQKLSVTPADVRLIEVSVDSRGNAKYSDHFFIIADDVYFAKNDSGKRLQLVEVDADVSTFGHFANQQISRLPLYEDRKYFFLVGQDTYKAILKSEVNLDEYCTEPRITPGQGFCRLLN